MLRATLRLAGRTFQHILKPQSVKCYSSPKESINLVSYDLVTSRFSSFSSAVISRLSNSFLQPPEKNVKIQRSLTKFSLQSGKRKSVKAVLKRFYRLDWGIWIHGKCGRNKKLYKKSANRKRRLRQHVFTNATQSWLLDSMVTRYWRKPKYYVDDPYEPYHRREEFPFTRRKPILQ